MASGIIEHEGIVSRVEGDRVYVKITSQSACGTCKAREACGLAEAQEKIVEVTTPGAQQHYTAGVYYCVLWLFRHKIEHTIHFSITKNY